ncbi:MAG: hypothetical protein VR64_18330 [Desulfatitalea sp. BRH_c12]|nr:MAG: hypothetical protein VR64_18330 [Desulfatitalea sp. BRH_c12]
MSHSESTRAAAFQSGRAWWTKAVDLTATVLLWAYFTLGFAVFFGPFYLVAAVFAPDRRRAFQWLNHLFYRGFFLLCRLMMPRQHWCIDPSVRNLRSSVIVCNHVSYIDSILLVSLFARHTTIVKNRLFRFPFLNWVMMGAGYLPSASEGRMAALMVERLESLPAFLSGGGNLIVFPEGTRSRTGAIGPLNSGAFKIAKMGRAPLAVCRVRNTDRLFRPGRFLFNTCQANRITVDLLACWTPDYNSEQFSLKKVIERVRMLLEEDSGKKKV